MYMDKYLYKYDMCLLIFRTTLLNKTVNVNFGAIRRKTEKLLLLLLFEYNILILHDVYVAFGVY